MFIIGSFLFFFKSEYTVLVSFDDIFRNLIVVVDVAFGVFEYVVWKDFRDTVHLMVYPYFRKIFYILRLIEFRQTCPQWRPTKAPGGSVNTSNTQFTAVRVDQGRLQPSTSPVLPLCLVLDLGP